jgi:shikimate kinase
VSSRLTGLLSARAPVYEEVADFVVDVDNKSPEEIATEILTKFCDN